MDSVNKELLKTSSNVKYLGNSLRPFYRLHPDIITEISEYLDPRVSGDRYDALLRATQICRSWRDTLISQPSRWSFINGSQADLVPCLLDRSKNARLDVLIVSRRASEVIGYVNSHVDRLSSIRFQLHYDNGSIFEVLRDLDAAPTLRRLVIEYRGGLLSDPPGYTPGIIGPTPSLHYLQLLGFPITPELVQLRNLTVVGLDARCAAPRAVLDLLSRNPLLKSVYLWGRRLPGDLDGNNGHPPGSITLNHLKVLWLEMTPLVHLEALSPPHGARIFSGFIRGGSYGRRAVEGICTASVPIPASFSNLRDLRRMRLVDGGEIYVELEGEKGSISYCVPRDRPFIAETFRGVPLEEVSDATYELSPLFRYWSPVGATTSRMISHIVCGMVRLQKLVLSRCADEVEHFFLVLNSANVCRDLKVLVLSHCVEPHRQMRGLAVLAEGRKAAGVGLDIVRIIHSNIGQLKATFGQGQEYVTRLERAVGVLECVEDKLCRPGAPPPGFDPEVDIDNPYIFL